ncbi:hypothetical protein EVAR_3954_1 [Eumeta japonica]|uniref:Uncharacterized protein n=1 Tax=Eumeta variegata TaxID=151549 RepID=A0A4C1SQW9_EUMVA|nr:hypothetical protein EVAR_3954_1 [Eumeta japonica]
MRNVRTTFATIRHYQFKTPAGRPYLGSGVRKQTRQRTQVLKPVRRLIRRNVSRLFRSRAIANESESDGATTATPDVAERRPAACRDGGAAPCYVTCMVLTSHFKYVTQALRRPQMRAAARVLTVRFPAPRRTAPPAYPLKERRAVMTFVPLRLNNDAIYQNNAP